MPATLSQVAANTASVSVPVGDDAVTVVYFPGKLTEKLFGDLQSIMNAGDGEAAMQGIAALNDALVTLIKSWDLMENDGSSPVPVTAERLPDVPIMFRLQVLTAIAEDIQGNQIAAQTAKAN